MESKIIIIEKIPDTPATKTSRDLKESAPVAAPVLPTANDSKPLPQPQPQPQPQPSAESKTLQSENSPESSEKEAENDRRAPIVSVYRHWLS